MMRGLPLIPSVLALLAGSALVACMNDSSDPSPIITADGKTGATSAKLEGCDANEDGDGNGRGHRGRGEREEGDRLENERPFHNPNGSHATLSTRDGRFLDTDNAFFKALGSNGRSCATCHAAENAFSVSAASIAERFDDSCGTDPLFRTNDGSNNPNADVSTLEAKRAAYSLLIERGLFRIHLPIPSTANFKLVAVDDPYGNDTSTELSVFRRPLPSTNLKFGPVIMWDGREKSLVTQARNATIGHAQGPVLDDGTLQSIVDFESALFTTQVVKVGAGRTDSGGATGDPTSLSTTPFFVGMNRTFPHCTTTTPVSCNAGPISVATNDVFTLYDAWGDFEDDTGRAAVARGQHVFNTKRFVDPAVGPAQPVTCSNCHNSQNSGAFSGGLTPPAPPFGGIPTVAVSAPKFRAGLPLYTFASLPGARTPTGALVPPGTLIKTTDPGMALRSGLWRDMNRFKVPQLRGLSGRAPYFHNGLAPTLDAVVAHYDNQFHIGFTEQEKSDLTAFLASL